MKSLRRSFNQKDSHGSHGHLPISAPLASLPPISRPIEKTQPPKKVIRATDNYRSRAPQELGFSKGDFFHVTKEIDPSSDWYEANNPMTGARGLVPKHLFEEFGKGNIGMGVPPPTRSNVTSISAPFPSPARTSQGPSPRLKTFFAVVMHEFQAERPDELDASSGDNITVVAQSNFEWFVAKPIGRLGRPGLIPVSFVEVKDPASGKSIPESNVADLMKSGEIPRVEDWKRAMIAYKAASIPLGVLDDTSFPPVPNSPFAPNYNTQGDSILNSQGDQQLYDPTPQSYPEEQSQLVYEPLPFGSLVKARIESFHYENGDYWFRISATWQPRDPETLSLSEAPGRLTIFRVYEDFYNFQIRILDAFPYEAGRSDDPNMETGISTRILPYMPGPVEAVDNVVSSLRQEELDQYLQQLTLLEQIDADYILRHELVREFFTPKAGDLQFRAGEEEVATQGPDFNNPDEVASNMQSLSLDPGMPKSFYRGGSSDGSHYDAAPPLSRDNSRNGPSSRYAERPGSSASRGYNPGDISPPIAPTSGRLRSGSNANAPAISATNSQTAFIKIKIFDRTSDDLIAIRVSPRVSHHQLLEKVRERLGGEIQILNYRDPSNTRFVPLDGDNSLRDWLEHTDKHVLYAE